MARSITIRSIDRRATKTLIRVGKSEYEVPTGNVAELRQWINDRMPDADDTLLFLALLIWAKRNPALDNPALLVGRTVTIDLENGQLNANNALLRIT